MPIPPDTPLSLAVTTWAVPTDAVPQGVVPHTYGEVHEMMHRDISIGNEFRKERIKLLIAVATGVFALMISFNKDLFSGHTSGPALTALLVGFMFLLSSILCGVYHFKAWEDFYLAHRGLSTGLWTYRTAAGDLDLQEAGRREIKKARSETRRLQHVYKYWDVLQYTLLLCGLALIVLYVGIQARQPSPESATPKPARGVAAQP